jgi:2-polyprenyl-3-methyl-5-hydroxy-6-metoxy-1,4-benzoquinol methylase
MKKVQADGRSNYYLSLSKVKKLDAWLKERYSIDCFVDFEEYYAMRGVGVTEAEHRKINRLIKEHQKNFKTENFEKKNKTGLALTNLYASDQWRSWWHSTRRAWLMDSITICSSIISGLAKKDKELSVIEIGCNVGILANYLAENHPIQVTGIDSSEAAITKALEFKQSARVKFEQCDLEDFRSEAQWAVAIGVDLVQPTEQNFASLIEQVGDLVKPNGDLIVIGNFVEIGNVDEYFQSIGFTCVGAQLTGGYQQGLSGEFAIDWSTKAALHLKKKLKLKSVNLPISGSMLDFADYANSGEFPPREVNRSYFLPRFSKNN